MCKTRFDSQGMILNGFYEKIFLKKKNMYGTRDPLHAIKKFHIFLEYISYEHLSVLRPAKPANSGKYMKTT